MPADNTPAKEPVTEPIVRIYNKRAHSIDGGKGAKVAAASFATVPKAVADAWMKQWPDHIVLASEAIQEVNGANAQAETLREENEKLKKELEALKAKPVKGDKTKTGADLV